MGDSDRGAPLLRVERGQATDVELAALTAVLLARCAGLPAAGHQDRRSPDSSWRWRKRQSYRAPRSWR
jgi:hypothetical protein